MKTDVLVIGSGLAGSLAALRAAEGGRRVTLVSAGESSLHMESGCIDLWGGSAPPGEAIQALIAAAPAHPYSLAGHSALREGVAAFLRLTEEGGYAYQGGLERNRLVPTAIGTLRPTALVPPTMAGVETDHLRSLLVVGIPELKDSYPDLAAANLAAVLRIPVRHEAVSLGQGEFAELTPMQAASLLDHPQRRRAFVERLVAVYGGEQAVGLPPVLGLRSTPVVLAELREALQAAVFEMPALSPSVPGMRLAEVLSAALRRAGVRLVRAEAVKGLAQGNRATGVRLDSPGGEGEVACDALVLATGGLAGGSYALAEGRLRERLFGLSVGLSDNPDDWTSPRWLEPEGQPLSRAGVVADSLLRPLGPDGKPAYENLFLAGRILAGYDPLVERCGNGVAIASGYRAGLLAAEVSAA